MNEKACGSLNFLCRDPGRYEPWSAVDWLVAGGAIERCVSACWTRERVEPVWCLGRCSDLLSLLGIHLCTLLRMLCNPSTCQMVGSVTRPRKPPNRSSADAEGHPPAVTDGRHGRARRAPSTIHDC